MVKMIVSKELLDKFKAWRRDKRKLQSQIDITIEKMQEQIKYEIYDLFNDKKEEIKQRQEDIWSEIIAELGIDARPVEPDSPCPLKLNHFTGEVTIAEEEDNQYDFIKGKIKINPKSKVLELVKKDDEPIL